MTNRLMRGHRNTMSTTNMMMQEMGRVKKIETSPRDILSERRKCVSIRPPRTTVRTRGAAVHAAVVDAADQDHGRGRVHAETDGDQHGNTGHRSVPRERADDGAHDDPEGNKAPIDGAESDGEAHTEVAEQIHEAPPCINRIFLLPSFLCCLTALYHLCLSYDADKVTA